MRNFRVSTNSAIFPQWRRNITKEQRKTDTSLMTVTGRGQTRKKRNKTRKEKGND